MGRLVESLSPAHGFEVVACLDGSNNRAGEGLTADRIHGAEVAIDFSTASAFVQNFPRLAALNVNVVVGTTGWREHEADVRRTAEEAGIGVVAAANFSLGANLFQALVQRAARLFAPHEAYGAWLHEQHHAAKRDAPSGTALALQAAIEQAGFRRPVDVASTRAGFIPGTHTVGFDGPFESITLTHAARDRAAFAYGALQAARWISGRRGWFTMRDVLELE